MAEGKGKRGRLSKEHIAAWRIREEPLARVVRVRFPRTRSLLAGGHAWEVLPACAGVW